MTFKSQERANKIFAIERALTRARVPIFPSDAFFRMPPESLDLIRDWVARVVGHLVVEGRAPNPSGVDPLATALKALDEITECDDPFATRTAHTALLLIRGEDGRDGIGSGGSGGSKP
jgi:hypothetical protein